MGELLGWLLGCSAIIMGNLWTRYWEAGKLLNIQGELAQVCDEAGQLFLILKAQTASLFVVLLVS